MKKVLAIASAVALTLASFSAQAQIADQENVLFNHWSIGVGFGFTEGIQITAGTTILPNLQGRIVYNTLSPVVAIANPIVAKFAPEYGVNPISATIAVGIHETSPRIDVDEVNVNGNIHDRSLALLADFFPSKKSSFHITGGVMFNIHPQLVSLTATLVNKSSSEPAIDPSNYANTEFFGITTDPEGKVHLGLQSGLNVVQPYLGIGFGRPVSLNSRVSFNFDLGVTYIGGFHLVSRNYYENPEKPVNVELNQAWIDANPDIKENMKDNYDTVTKYLNMVNGFPVQPYMRFTLAVRLF
ncbi:MAG: hypothetical protein II841_02255 [Bacteroidales bacterium]|nr:hypothetical protein [Bacteroidales bacterium]